MMNTKLALCLSVSFLAGCSTLGSRASIEVEEVSLQIQKHAEAQRNGFDPQVVRRLDYPVFTSNVVGAVEPEIPAILKGQVELADAEPLTIQQVANALQIKTGIPVRVQPDALVPMRAIGTGGVSSQFASQIQTADSANNISTQSIGIGGDQPSGTITSSDRAIVQYRGSIAGLLDQVAANFNLYWEYDGRAIVVGRYKTEQYQLHVIADTVDSEMGVGSSAGEESGGGEHTLSSSYTVSLWESVSNAVESMLSAGGTMSTAPGAATLIITDTPDVQRRVEAYIEKQNTAFLRQVEVRVKVLSVTRRESSQISTSLAALYNDGDISTAFTTPSVSGALSAVSGQVIEADSRFNGSSSVVAALQSLGEIQVSRETSLVTLNNQPAQVRLVSERSYLAEVRSVVTAGTDSVSNELRPDTVSTGVTLQVRPRVLPNDDSLIMQLGLDFSTLLGLETVSSGGQDENSTSIQVPNIDRRAFMNTVRLQTGDVLLLSGFNSGTDSRNRSGTGHYNNLLLGGAHTAEDSDTDIVVLLEPRILGE